jgi:O-methyltransferase involved in polyketide biosynthesis
VKSVRADRAFLGRVVRYLAGEAGVRQFLDIGTGLPTADNTHEVAQSVVPDVRVVYVDNDPVVLAHARALLTSKPPAVTAYLDADLREPEKILDVAAGTLDFGQPVAVLMLGSLNFVADDEQAHGIVHTVLDRLAPGSYLAISHPTDEVDAQTSRMVLQRWNEQGSAKQTLRDRAGLETFFAGLEMVGPGVVSASRWDPVSEGDQDPVSHFGGLGRKP